MNSVDSMSIYEREWCHGIVNKILKRKSSRSFADLLPNKNSNKTSDNILRLNLTEIKKKLESGDNYKLMEFVKDIRDIWYVTMCSFFSDTPIYLAAAEFSNWFEKKLINFPLNEEEKWLMKISKAKKSVQKLINTAPPMDLDKDIQLFVQDVKNL